MERPRRLTASFVKTVRRPGRYGDGRGGYGLSMLVKPTSTGRISRTWAQRLYIHGRAVNLGLGAYPLVTLREARAKALENRRTLARGDGPEERRHTDLRASRREGDRDPQGELEAGW